MVLTRTASGALTPDKTGFAGSAPTTGSYSQVGQAQLAQGGLQPQFAVGAEGASIGSRSWSTEALLLLVHQKDVILFSRYRNSTISTT